MKDSKVVVGLVENKDNIRFECGTCQHFKAGSCYHKNPKLHLRHVDRRWCCNLYEHPGMKTIVA